MTDPIPPLRPRFALSEYPDIAFQVLANQISSNYLKFIKTRLITALGDQSDVPIRELRTLVTLSHFEDAMSGVTLARLLSYDPATITRSTQWLMEAGYIDSSVNTRDGRSVVYSVTAHGHDLADLYRAASLEALAELDVMDDDPLERDEIRKAMAVMERVRERSRLAAKMADDIKRAQMKA